MKIRTFGLSLAILFTLPLVLPVEGFSETTKIITETFMVPAQDAGIQLHLRNKHPEGVSKFSEGRVVLFVHGATYPLEAGFDLPLGGVSWMDFVAQRGWDVYAMDLRGYGRSTRPPQMNQPPDQNPPIVRTGVAIKDLGTVAEYILKRRAVARINLVGWSWGTVITGAYTASNNSKVERLVLNAPLYIMKNPPAALSQGTLGAYRTVTKESARQRGLRGIPADRQQEISPQEWFDASWQASLATDPTGAAQNPPVLRAPNGIIEDLRTFWMADKPYYDPSDIVVPTLITLGEWDQDTPPYMAQAVYEKLTKSKVKRLVTIGEGTHALALEKNRGQLFREVQLFLEEPASDLQPVKGSRNTTVYLDDKTDKELVVYDLTGDWEADYKTNLEIVRITQKGPHFEGIKTIGNAFIPKGARTIQGDIQGSSIRCSVESAMGPVLSIGAILEDGDKFQCLGRSPDGGATPPTIFVRRR